MTKVKHPHDIVGLFFIESKGNNETHSEVLSGVICTMTHVNKKDDSALSYDKLVTTLTIGLLSDLHKDMIIKKYRHLDITKEQLKDFMNQQP